MRQILEPPEHTPRFPPNKAAGTELGHTCVFGLFRFCRILPKSELSGGNRKTIYATDVQQKWVVVGTTTTHLPRIRPKTNRLLLNTASQALSDRRHGTFVDRAAAAHAAIVGTHLAGDLVHRERRHLLELKALCRRACSPLATLIMSLMRLSWLTSDAPGS